MNYRSNLEAPDLRPYFRHIHERVEPNSQGHTVISDFADKAVDDPVFGVHKRCWFWTLDEAAILYNCAKQFAPMKSLDIGSHTGWTAGYLSRAGCWVMCVDPMFPTPGFGRRFLENLDELKMATGIAPMTSEQYFNQNTLEVFSVVVIDGNHSSPCPLQDAQRSFACLKDRACILLHDYRGEPIKEAYRWLLANGFRGKVYTTPNGVAVCWRGEFAPPEHVPDPKLEVCV